MSKIDEAGQLKRIDIDGVIYFDSILGIAGTTYPIGTSELPSNTIADVITLCGLTNTRHINVRGILALTAAMTAYRFEGYKHLDIAHTIDLNTQDVSVSSFHRLIVTGAQGGAGLASYDDCMLLSMTGFNGVATLCGLIIALTLKAATSSGFINCYSYLGTCTINLGTPTLANFVNLAGSFILANQTNGVTNIWAANGCEIVINASCTGGTINIYGNARVTDNSAAGCTVTNYTINVSADSRVAGKLQIAETTIDLDQVAATYDLFTGTTQDVIVESLVIRMPDIVCGGALTSISIQTDDTTPQEFIDPARGAVANLTAEAQLAWEGPVLIKVGTKIQLTIAGGAHGVEYLCDVVAECRAVVLGGYLA